MARRVLIADDAGFVRELLIQTTESLGYQVVGEANDGAEAIRLAKTLAPDIIFMDLVMPKYNGIEATRSILEVNPEISIIACSSMDDSNILDQAKSCGCRAFLRKPFSKESVRLVLQQMSATEKGERHG